MGRLIVDNKSLNLIKERECSQEAMDLYSEAEFLSEITKDNIFIAIEIASKDSKDYSCAKICEAIDERVMILREKYAK
jgi:hypothetical protein